MLDIENKLKDVLFAGVGAAVITAEKTKEIAEQLVDKGEKTIKRGKAINEELKKSIKEKNKNEKRHEYVENIIEHMDKMTSQEIDKIKTKIDNIKAAQLENDTKNE